MTHAPSLPSFAAVVVAAGKGLRAGQAVPKQFANWRGKPVLRHSVETLLAAGAEPIVVAIPEGAGLLATEALEGLIGINLVTGGDTRQASVRLALEELRVDTPDYVVIHDAARPDLPRAVLDRLLKALETSAGAIPVLPIVDSLAVHDSGEMSARADREKLCRVQTPQGFRLADISAAHRGANDSVDASDDAQVLHAAGGTIALVEGDERLGKLTFAEDFIADFPIVRTGMGFDVHRFEAGRELWLGGIRIEHDMGLAGHSDADVALHALVDALLGAVGAGDIGEHFPPDDVTWKGAASDRFITHAAKIVQQRGYTIANVDLTIICEAPKIGPHRWAMRERIANLIGIDIEQVGIKATTTEGLGYTGRGEGIAAQAIATLQRN